MSFKMDSVQCENVVRGQPEKVYKNRLSTLYTELSSTTGLENVYRLQGQILMLLEVSGLKEKANNQLRKK